MEINKFYDSETAIKVSIPYRYGTTLKKEDFKLLTQGTWVSIPYRYGTTFNYEKSRKNYYVSIPYRYGTTKGLKC